MVAPVREKVKIRLVSPSSVTAAGETARVMVGGGVIVAVRALLTINWARPVVLLKTLKVEPAKAPLPLRVPALIQRPLLAVKESPALPVISS